MNRGQLSPTIAVVDVLSIFLRNRAGKVQAMAIDEMMAHVIAAAAGFDRSAHRLRKSRGSRWRKVGRIHYRSARGRVTIACQKSRITRKKPTENGPSWEWNKTEAL